MSELRTWVESDPPPRDWPAVVDEDGVTWAVERDEDGHSEGYRQQLITHRPGPGGSPGVVLGGSCCNDWEDIFASMRPGAVLREATPEEARTWIERWVQPPT